MIRKPLVLTGGGIEELRSSQTTVEFARRSVEIWLPPGNATTLPGVIGMPAVTAQGTIGARNVATTDAGTQQRRVTYAATAAANAVSGVRRSTAQMYRGDAAYKGGFNWTGVFVVPPLTFAAGSERMFIGVYASTAVIGNVDPSTFVNCFGLAKDNTDTNFFIMHNDAAGTCTRIDLGASFPTRDTTLNLPYLVNISCEPNASTMEYHVEHLGTGAIASGSASSNLPVNTTLMTWHISSNSSNAQNPVATFIATPIDPCRVYSELAY